VRTDDRQTYEVCCIPFFPYNLSLGDVVSLTSADGEYAVTSRGGRRTLRIVIQDQAFLHKGHDELHEKLTDAGVLSEFRGHALGHYAVDIVDQGQADALLEYLEPLASAGTLSWEWADPSIE
jgi:Domain of unknown function (DUF4265)